MTDKPDYSLMFGIDDHDKFVNHWMLEDLEVVELLRDTPECKNDPNLRGRHFTARVTVNGVELPFSSLEKLFDSWGEQMERTIRAQYSDLDKEVERRLVEKLKKETQPILDKLYDLQRVLEDPGQLLTPYWERKNGDDTA